MTLKKAVSLRLHNDRNNLIFLKRCSNYTKSICIPKVNKPLSFMLVITSMTYVVDHLENIV